MNANPLLVKSALLGKIPFMKGKTLGLYSKYLSDNRFSKALKSNPDISETLSAFNLDTRQPVDIDFIFDSVDINPDIYFSEREWIALGMLLRAYKEVEGLGLMHLYNCLYRAENKTVYGHVVTGRVYTLYSSTQLNTRLIIHGKEDIVLINHSLNPTRPFVFKVPDDSGVESLVKIELEFSGSSYQPATLVEGEYGGIKLSTLKDPFAETRLIPETIKIGEYSDKLVEFFAGTLVTKLSDSKLRGSLSSDPIKDTPGWHNKDGYIDRRIVE